jgi:hypothetical protein
MILKKMYKVNYSLKIKYDYEIENIDRFISNCSNEKYPVMIHVQNEKGKIEKSFELPSGFQLQKYVESVYPDHLLDVTNIKHRTGENILKIVVKNKNNVIIKTYLEFASFKY